MIRQSQLGHAALVELAHHNLRVARSQGATRNAWQIEAWLDDRDPGWRNRRQVR